MERIIITEVDNTSNVEALSSYDVVYVPGFSTIERSKEYTNEGEASLYRNPTLVTSKYQFINLFGKDAPVFAVDQEYPVDEEGAKGFPAHAIPNYTPVELKTDPIELKTFTGADAGAAQVKLEKYYEILEAGASIVEGINHFVVTTSEAEGAVTLTLSDYNSETPGEVVIAKAQSGVNPYKMHWFEKTTEGKPFRSLDTDLPKIADNKVYYELQSGLFTPPMFNGGTDADPGYRIALYLLSLGIPVYYEQMNATADEITVAKMYQGLEARFARTEDPDVAVDYSFDNIGDYSVKYITSGGYPTFEHSSGLAENMIRLAWDRGDAIALIDHTNNPDRSIRADGGLDSHSVIDVIRRDFEQLGPIVGSYGAMFTPWYECTNSAITGGTLANYQAQMPGSVAFLSALAVQLRDYNPWLAVSGVTRGQVPYCARLHTNQPLTNNIADSYQELPNATGETAISINPITYIRNYGYCIWGNRTLRDNRGGTRATSFLNIRDLTSDIKKTLYEASQRLLFEQNNDVLWINFKAQITPLLDTMVSNYILSDYKIVKYTRDPETGEPVPAYKVLAVIRIMPINSTEIFELSVHLENNELAVAE